MFRSFVMQLSLVAALGLYGCAQSPRIVPSEVQFRDLPAIGQSAAAEIGESLLLKSKEYVYDGITLLERISDHGAAREYIMEPHSLPLERIAQDGREYYVPSKESYYVLDKLLRQKEFPHKAYLIRTKEGALELSGYFDLTTAGRILPERPSFRIGKIVDTRQPYFRQELIYGGRSGSTVKFVYREFRDNFI